MAASNYCSFGLKKKKITCIIRNMFPTEILRIMCLPSSRWVNDRNLSSYSTTSDHRVSWFSQPNHHTTHQVRWDDDELECGGDTDINHTCGPTMLCPGLAWPRLTIPQECQFRGNNPTWYPLRPEPYVPPALVSYFFPPFLTPPCQLSCTDVNTLSQFALTLLNIFFL